ncbi:DNA topoisomerase 3 [Paenibacillus abyssi]|uniref:DNA topoisomerase n=1 Tax=Paenibacillus abyssi TaxID=1340531 RepID=A0A917G1B0_9BACL|nr:DNA topoisomerase 3 [Paenibacillus abyssi]GGG17775.1 hypothetical protein GCM10010916_38240 [Paenibacillus abyssi]
MRLVIAEKRDQAKKLAAPFPHQEKDDCIEISPCPNFPKGGFITWAAGHLIELIDPEKYDPKYETWRFEDLPIIPDPFRHTVTREKSKLYNNIKTLVHDPRVTEITNACDPAREGSLICHLILKVAGNQKPVNRLWTKSLTPQAIKKAFDALIPEEEKIGLYYEAEARQRADWLVGMNLSRAYTLKLKEKKYNGHVFSVGRVQTALLSLIVKRELERESFVSTPFWEVYANFDMDGATYLGKWYTGGKDRIESYEKANALATHCSGKPATVEKVDVEQIEELPPQLFSMSSIQTAANKRYKFSPKQTDAVLQSLYLAEYISYPRTDNPYITEDDAQPLPLILEQIGKLPPYSGLLPAPMATLIGNQRYVNADKVSDHYALLPTEKVPDLKSLSDDEQKIYDMIVKRLIAAHYESALVEKTTIHTYVDNRFSFKTSGKRPLREGWRTVYAEEQKEDAPGDEELTAIPPIQAHQTGRTLAVETKEGKTTAPQRFTEGDLIPLMISAGRTIEDKELVSALKEAKGLGTESTRSGMIQTLKARKYIEVKSNLVYPTRLGRLIIEAVGESVLTSAEMTAQWEMRLAQIGKGKAAADDFIAEIKKLTAQLVSECGPNVSKMPDNRWEDNELTKGKGEPNKGEQAKGGGTSSPTGGSPGRKSGPVNLNASHAADNPTRAPYAGPASGSPPTAGTGTPVVNPSAPNVYLGTCPECAAGQIVDRGTFYGCLHYTEGCRFTFNKVISGVTITPDLIVELLETGQTPLISGFKKRGKENETFEAVLTIKSGKLSWRFPNWNAIKLPTRLLLPDDADKELSQEQHKQIRSLETACSTLKLPAKVVNVVNGPIITRYELTPDAMDINVKRFDTYKANFQMALQAERIAMQIPIPGTKHIGIEVPSPTPYVVNLRSLLENKEFLAKKESLSFPVGTDLHGKPVFANLAEMPHLLIAGTTGSGKSVCLGSIIVSLLFGNTPDELKFVFIDPKRVELIAYQSLPHLMLPVVTDMNRAEDALMKVIEEMESRYELFKDMRVNNIQSYNEKIMLDNPDNPKMPYLVVVIDEFASLMLTAKDKGMENIVIRLSQEARAAGIHMVLATQRPVAKVFSPTIKANLPTRISFMVTSTNESMVILDEPGAEGLLGKGDMYFKYRNLKKRLVSPFVSGPEINRVVSYILMKQSNQSGQPIAPH